MLKGWPIISQLENQDPDLPIDSKHVEQICNELSTFNNELKNDLIKLLHSNKFGKWASGLSGEYKASDEKLFNCYFSNQAFSPDVLSRPPQSLGGPRCAVLFYLSFDLQSMLIEHMRGIPNAKIIPSSDDNGKILKSKHRIYQFVEFEQVIRVIKSVQYELEGFYSRSENILRTNDPILKPPTNNWAFDFELLQEIILLGFMRGPEGIINQGILSSAIVAAGVIRSHLEAVLFRNDFQASLNMQNLTNATKWDGALKIHKNNGHLNNNEITWVKETYKLLSGSLHQGLALSRGEVWMMIRIVKHISNKLLDNYKST